MKGNRATGLSRVRHRVGSNPIGDSSKSRCLNRHNRGSVANERPLIYLAAAYEPAARMNGIIGCGLQRIRVAWLQFSRRRVVMSGGGKLRNSFSRLRRPPLRWHTPCARGRVFLYRGMRKFLSKNTDVPPKMIGHKAGEV